MLRTSFGLLALLSVAGCGVDEDGGFVFCFSGPGDCGVDPDAGPATPPAPVHPISFGFDRGKYQLTNRLALGGVMKLDVDSRAAHVPSVTAIGGTLDLEVTSAEKHKTTVDVFGLEVGEGTISATIPIFDQPATLGVEVVELASIEIRLPEENPRDQLIVLPDIRELALRLNATDGAPVLDHSLAIDASSDPGFVLSHWDAVTIPATPGDHVLALTRAAGDLHEVSVTVVDHVDAVVADTIEVGDGVNFGKLCVHAEVGGVSVATHAWKFRGTNIDLFTQTDECIQLGNAVPGATVTVELAGQTTSFVILPPQM